MKFILRLVKNAVREFIDDKAISLAAAQAFFAVLSLAPLVILLVSGASLLGADIQQQFISQIESSVGPKARDVVDQIVTQARKQRGISGTSSIAGLAVLLFAATGVFVRMQDALNAMWGVQAVPGHMLWRWLRKRFFSFGMILTIGFLLLVSLILSAAIRLLFTGTSGLLWRAGSTGASLLVFTILFALIYKFLPDMEIAWKDVWIGGLLTAIMFAVGEFAVSVYLGRRALGSMYGAAGSLVVLLLWVYYVTLIFYFGTELTQVYARDYGRGLEPESHAQRISDGALHREKADRNK